MQTTGERNGAACILPLWHTPSHHEPRMAETQAWNVPLWPMQRAPSMFPPLWQQNQVKVQQASQKKKKLQHTPFITCPTMMNIKAVYDLQVSQAKCNATLESPTLHILVHTHYT